MGLRSPAGSSEPLASTTPRILILRLSAIGDVAMASGILPALRSRWPDAHLAWLVEPAAAPLLAHNTKLDELIVWPRAEWLALWKTRRLVTLFGRLMAFRRSLRAALRAGGCGWRRCDRGGERHRGHRGRWSARRTPGGPIDAHRRAAWAAAHRVAVGGERPADRPARDR